MTTKATDAEPSSANDWLRPGHRVRILDAPPWCRRYFAGRSEQVVRMLPFPGGDVWVRFERPVSPWCARMGPVEAFPFSRDDLAAA